MSAALVQLSRIQDAGAPNPIGPAGLPQPRLLFVVNDLACFFSHRLSIARVAREAGFEVHIAVRGAATSARLRAEGMHGHHLALDRGLGSSLWRELAALNDLRLLLRRLAPDLVHFVTLKPVLYGGILLRLFGGGPAVFAVNGLGSSYISSSWTMRLLRAAYRVPLRFALGYHRARVIVQNTDDYVLLTGFTERSRLVLIKGSGADPNQFRPAPRQCASAIVVLAARMLWDKGVGEFVAAARLLKAKGSDARFVLVGETDPCNPTAIAPDQLEAWRAEGVVEWWGFRSDMPAILQRAHIACLPSYREGLPKFLIEAAAAGLPIVTSDCPGCREIVRNGENGFLVPPRRVAELALALERLLDDPVLRGRQGQRGRERVLQEFSDKLVVDQTMALYRTMLAAAATLPAEDVTNSPRCRGF